MVRLKVQDRNKFIADMKAAGISVRGMGNEVDRAGRLFSQGTHHGFLWNQMLFTIRRTIYSVTLALAAMAAGALTVGFRFNSMLEQQQLAFRRFTGSVAGANREVNFLFNLAAHGPFQFQQVIQGSRQLMAFGFTVQRTNFLLTNLQDAMAGMGLDQAALDRATLALGQIQSSGRLLGQDLRQLEQLGLVNPQDLARRLNIDPRQIANIGQLNIPSKYAIDAIVAYWQQRFHGAAKDFQKTWVGQWSTMKDYASQLFGSMVRGMQTRLETGLMPRIQNVLNVAATGAKTGGMRGALTAVDQRYSTNTIGIYNSLIFVFRQLVTIVTIFYTTIFHAYQILGVGASTLRLVGVLLWAIAHVLIVLQPILPYIIAYLVAERIALQILTIWQARNLVLTKGMVIWEGLMRRARLLGLAVEYAQITAMRLMWFIQMALTTEGWLLTTATYAYYTALGFARAATWSLYLLMLRSRILWVAMRVASYAYITAVYAVAAAEYILTAAFGEEAIAAAIAWAATLAPITIVLAALAAVAAAIYLIIRYWHQLTGMFNRVTHPFHNRYLNLGVKLATDYVFGLPALALGGIPGLASGGHVRTGGLTMVGERGPELLSLPSGASVAPLGSQQVASLGGIGAALGSKTLELRVPLYLDRRQIAEAVASYQLDTAARA